MLFSLHHRDESNLSWRTRAYIRVHHLAVAALIAWVTFLFVI